MHSLKLPSSQTNAVIELLDSGNTIPFIARYRKEATGGLDEEQIRQIAARLEKQRSMDKRRTTIRKTIREQGQLTPELDRKLQAAATLTELEDLYQPYKPKRRTRAGAAKEKGLQGLADLILQQPRTRQTAAQLAAPYLCDQAPTPDDAYAGARDIAAETISDNPEIRQRIRKKALQWAALQSAKIKKAEDLRARYELYYEYEIRLDRLRPHQTLALNRGEAEKIIRIKINVPERDWRQAIEQRHRPDNRSPLAVHLAWAIEDAAQRLLLPAIERDIRRALTEKAETHAINIFAQNLRALLAQPPLAGHTILGLDPGYRSGCKLAIVDPTGKTLATGTIYPHPPQRRINETLIKLKNLIRQRGVTLIAIGNGTASRETEQLIADLIRNTSLDIHYLIVSEAGASVYSASKLARAELPNLDVSLRGAVSIARRVQDPLAELVKIDPKSIGVGLYQHDVNQKQLTASLDAVIESVVNQIGVNANTASPALLTHVAGIGPTLAARIVAHRDQHGPFPARRALQDVSGLGPKAYQQAAGFLRITNGENPLDATAIHPESYPLAKKILQQAGIGWETPPIEREPALQHLLTLQPLSALADKLGAGIPTLTDIFEQLARPGRDPRADLPAPILRSDVLSMEDLATGMELKGTVRNVVDFGAFIDLGVKHDGLLHRSQIPRGTVLRVGDVIDITIQKIEPERGRIGLGWPGK